MKINKRILSGALAFSLSMTLTLPALAATAPFSDVPENAWYASDLVQVQELGIFSGKGNNQFDPQGTLTIAEAIALTARTRANYNGDTIPTVEGAWYQSAVDYATKQGILTGTEFPTYTAMATCAEMAYLFAHALPDTEYKALNNVLELPDVNSSSKYSVEIFRLYNSGVLTGSDEYGTFNYDKTITRAEAAVILNRVVNATTRITIELKSPPQVQTFNEGEAHTKPQVGDIVIKDGKEIVITATTLKDGSVVLGLYQGVDIITGTKNDLGTNTYRLGTASWYDQTPFKQSSLTGEVFSLSQWKMIKITINPVGLVGDYDGEVYNTYYQWNAAEQSWKWIGGNL